MDSDQVLDRIVEWGQRNELIRAVILEGSRATQDMDPDRFSDYDVAFVVTDVGPFIDRHDWEAWFGEPAIHWGDRQLDDGVERWMRLVVYGDGTRIDYCFWSTSAFAQVKEQQPLPAILDSGYRVLLDKDGIAEALPSPTYRAHVPAAPTEAEFLILLDDFWLDAAYVAKSLARGELLPAKYGFSLLAFSHLRRLLEWSVEIDRGWAWRPGRHGRGLQRAVSPGRWQRLEQTFAGADLEDNWRSLWTAFDLHRELVVEVAELLGFTYPHDRDAGALSYLQRLYEARNAGSDPSASLKP